MTTELKNDTHWVSNYQKGATVEIAIGASKEKVFISKCTGATVVIKGKCNAINVDNFTEGAIVFDDVIAGFDVTNSKKIQVQANGAVPQFQLDKSHGVTLFLQTAGSQSATIATSQTSTVNSMFPQLDTLLTSLVTIPGATENDDDTELAVPEQFITTYANGKLTTRAADHV